MPADSVTRCRTPRVAELADRLLALEDDARAAGTTPDPTALRTGREALRRAADEDWRAVLERIREVIGGPFVHEAVLWQNRAGWHTGVARVVSGPIDMRAKARSGHLLAIKYLQRYALKNETIGFFGPSCWFEIGDEPGHATIEPGSGLVAETEVYLERWALEVLAKALCAPPERRQNLCPTVGPFFGLHDGKLFVPTGDAIPLEPLHATLLEACDGMTPTSVIAERLASEGQGATKDVVGAVDELVGRGWLSLDVPFRANMSPEAALSEWLDRVNDAELAKQGREALVALEQHREELGRVAGDPAATDEALGALERTFHELTGEDATRLDGAVYGGRQLVYSECSRDLSFRLGADFLARIGPALDLVLSAAHWFDHDAKGRFMAAVDGCYERVAARMQRDTVPMAMIHIELLQSGLFVTDTTPAPVAETRRLFDEKLSSLLPLDEQRAEARFDSAALRAQWAELFPELRGRAPQYICPDLLVMAEDAAAVSEGRYRMLLGEIHIGNTLAGGLAFTWTDPARERVERNLGADGVVERVFPVPPRDSLWGRSHRFSGFVSSAFDYAYPLAPGTILVEGQPRLAAGTLEVSRRDGELTAHTRDGGIEVTLIDLLGHLIGRIIGSSFSMYRTMARHPRIVIDDVILTRRRWRIPLDDTPAMGRRSTFDSRYAMLRRWQRERGLPDRAFYSVPGELKPSFVDFESLLLVDNFARGIRVAKDAHKGDVNMSLSEMLPDLCDVWLPDRAGGRYTSELRLCALPHVRE